VLRRFSTGRLLGAIIGALVAIGAVTAGAIAAIGGGPVPPPKPLDQAIKAAIDAPKVSGVTARVSLVNSLVDTGSLPGSHHNPVLSGGDGRLWVTGDGRVRLELFSSRGDTQLSIDGPAHTFTFYDASSNTAYKGQLPAHADKTGSGSDAGGGSSVPALKSIDDALAHLAQHADVGAATPTNVAGQPAYSVRVTPQASEGGMIGAAQIAWDAVHGVPLDVAIFAKGSSTPALELKATQISFGSIPASDLQVAIPSGAKVNELDTASAAGKAKHDARSTKSTTGLAAVRAALPFTLDAPATLDGLSQASVREMTVSGTPAALIEYGKSLGTVFVLESATTAADKPKPSSGTNSGESALPTATINGAQATVLPTALGTIVRFERNGISYTVAGSVPRNVAVAVASGL
jgi:hypothetical protein